MNAKEKDLLGVAHAIHQSGDLEGAVAAFETVLADFPLCGEAWFGLGTIALQAGQYQPAIDMLNKAIECDGLVGIYFINLGEAYRRVGKVDAALAVLRVACDIDPSNPDAWLNFGVAQADLGDLAVAEEALLKAADLGSLNPAVYRNLGVAKLKASDWEKAMEFFQMAIGLGPHDYASWCGMGEVLRQQGHPSQSVNAYRKAVELDPNASPARVGLATSLFAVSEAEEAEGILAGVLQDYPTDNRAWVAKGELHLSKKEDEEAIACFKRAIELSPLDEGAYLMLASVYERREELEPAAEILLRAMAMRPRDVAIMRKLADVYRDMKETKAAIALLKQAMAIAPDDHRTLYALGSMFSAERQWKDAEPLFKKAVEVEPANTSYWNAYSWALYRLDRLDDAMAAIDRGLELCPDSNMLLSNRGAVYFDIGYLDKAYECFKTIITRAPLDYSAWANLGMACDEMGRRREARHCFTKAFEITREKGIVHPALVFNSGSFELRCGNLEAGWKGIDQREIAKRYDHLASTPWNGESLEGKRLLIWEDQGIGDQLMFASIYQEAIDQAGQVVIECPPKLLSLLRRSFPKAIVVPKNCKHPLVSEGVDYRIPSAGLGRWFRPALKSFPRSKKGYLKVDPVRLAYWRQRLQKEFPGELLVGICWRSSMRSTRRSQHYVPLELLRELVCLPGVRFINLQYDKCADEIEVMRRDFGSNIVNFAELDMYNDIDETCAMISCLDLVISAPTAVAIMSGALGVRTWGLVRNLAWTMLGTRRLPFLPAVEKVYPRNWDENWEGPLRRVTADLREWVEKQ